MKSGRACSIVVSGFLVFLAVSGQLASDETEDNSDQNSAAYQSLLACLSERNLRHVPEMFSRCIGPNVDSIVKVLANEGVDELSELACRFVSPMKLSCVQNLIKNIDVCLSPSQKETAETILRAFNASINYSCSSDNRVGYTALLTCIYDHKNEFMRCQAIIPLSQVRAYVGTDYNEVLCRKQADSYQCFRRAAEQCSDQRIFDFLKQLDKAVTKEIPCPEFESIPSTDSPSNYGEVFIHNSSEIPNSNTRSNAREGVLHIVGSEISSTEPPSSEASTLFDPSSLFSIIYAMLFIIYLHLV